MELNDEPTYAGSGLSTCFCAAAAAAGWAVRPFIELDVRHMRVKDVVRWAPYCG
jgi:hypothetical protein